jgi:hypothetical protein
MANIRFLFENKLAIAASAASASGEVSSLPAANAQVPDPSLVWRSTTTTGDQWWRVTFASALTVKVVALKNVTLHTGGGTLKAQYSTDGGASWTDYGAIPAIDTDSRCAFFFGATVSAQDWRFYFTNVGATSSYVELGFGFVGDYYEPSINVQASFDAPLTDRSVVTESLSGNPSTTIRPQQTTGAYTFNDAPDADRSSLQAMFRAQGYGMPFFAVLDTSDAWTCWLIAFRSQIDRTFEEIYHRYVLTFSWSEVL